ncbi:Osmotic avoidance abnormal protein 3 [Trichuris trichiura]|uniref:Kinesin-like protein n=1 Tax=Trichuris trichiura TaxID=36087 RepID=A0A077Z565_TRITR|nr:Osmotic avoidance abnormal protein 3 [Trichuris trichiura]
MPTSECVRVVVRSRPLNEQEMSMGCTYVLDTDPSCCQCTIANPADRTAEPKVFTFDAVFDKEATTELLYNDVVYSLVESVLEGYNGTVFAYGQTGSGKSFTMQGPDNWPVQKGIVPRTFEHIFEAISTTENVKFLICASYLEIYIEDVRDLLGRDTKQKLEIKEHQERGVYVAGLSMHPVHNVNECEKLLQKGMRNRATAATLMNTDSSRSHSIFTLHLEMFEVHHGREHIKTAKLHLVDLAGSERQSKTRAVGDRLKEATKINLSLSALGNVISALVDGKSTHIPYRDSKLTRLLQDSLGGNTKTIMIACLSPADYNYEESLSTLRYANRAKNIRNRPRINEDPKDALLRQYQQEIERLKGLLRNVQQPTQAQTPSIPSDDSRHELEKKQLRMDYERKMAAIEEQFRMEQITKSRLEKELSRLRDSYDRAIGRAENNEAGLASNFAAQTGMNTEQAIERLKMLEEQIIGGEQLSNKALVEKRKQKKRDAERRRRQMREMERSRQLQEEQMMDAYKDVNHTLQNVQGKLEMEKRRNKALEKDVQDLYGEFERERQDYLDTIRKQNQQLKLLSQLLDKVKPCIPRDCNYADLEGVQRAAVWDADCQNWNLPEVIITKTKLPKTASCNLCALADFINDNEFTFIANSLRSASSSRQDQMFLNGEYSSDSDSGDEILRQVWPFFCSTKLGRKVLSPKIFAKSEAENIAGTYFKPLRQRNVASTTGERGYSTTWQHLQNGVLYTDDLYAGGSQLTKRKPCLLGANFSNRPSPNS